MRMWSDFGIEVPPGASGEIDTTCPECSGRRKNSRAKCLSVNIDDGLWRCHHCLWSGSLGQGQRTASEADPYGAPLRPKEWQRPRPLPEVVTPTTWDKAVSWFAARGIPREVLVRNGVTVADEWCPVCEAKVGHVLFPYLRGADHVNTKHRCGQKHFRMEKGAERVLYGLNDVATATTVVIVEGEIDKLSCEAAGYRNCLSVPDGAPAPDATNYATKFAFLETAKDLFDRATTVILATDADAPGQALLEELARRIGREKCRRVTWPDGIKDANECLVEVGAGEVARCLEDAEPYPIEGMIDVADLHLELDALYESGFDVGVTAGWTSFDRHYRTRVGLMTVVTGIASHGKSHFLDALVVRLALRHGWAFAICSPENQPLERHLAGIISTYAGKPFHKSYGDRMTKAEMHEARDWVAEHFAFVLPEEPTIDAILDRARAYVFRKGIKGLVVDPWNELEHSRPANKTETEYVSECLGKMRRFARHYRVHLWLVAHPTKMKRDEDGEEPVPGLWDISGSAHFRNKADAGLSVWRDVKDTSKPVQVHVLKVRFAETGEPGMVEFRYSVATGQYQEVGGVRWDSTPS